MEEDVGAVTAVVDLIEEAEREVEQVGVQVWELNNFLGDLVLQREERFRVFSMEVREVVYAAQDICDSFLLHEQKPSNIHLLKDDHHERRLSLAKHLIFFARTKLPRMIRRLHYIDESIRPGIYRQYHRRARRPNHQAPTMSPDKIVGLRDEAETLMKNVIWEESDRLGVISITGMPGIGKTTLAWKIYQDEKIQQEFPTRIWINLPQNLDRYDLYVHILKQLNVYEQPHGLPVEYHDRRYEYRNFRDRLVEHPFEFFRNIKFLLVLDNLWSHSDWTVLWLVLPIGNGRGKVLITSQSESVCARASSPKMTLKLRLLNEHESWELLQLQVFGKLDACPDRLQPIGKMVAENCDGLPLAIHIIGRNLVVATSTNKAQELTEHLWRKVGKNVSMYVTQCKKQGASSTLELSYNVLPPKMRDCFLYLGVFPEDCEIPASILTRLWISEGFIEILSGQSLEVTAEDVLLYLIQSNLVMVHRLNHYGKVKTCRVHRVIHGFCRSKALEKNLFQEINMSSSLTPYYRRLSIQSNLLEYLSQKPYGPGVRSILCFKEGRNDVLEAKHTSSIHKSFKFLKVFESKSSIKFAEFPIKLTRLLNLTYISLSLDYFNSVLPETICDLLNLQTLIVATNSPVLEIKGNVWRMIKLRHLITKAAITLPTQGEAAVEGSGELQTLTRLSPKHCTRDMLGKSCDLKKLGVRGILTLDHLQTLRSEPSCFPSSLTNLTLSETYLDWEHVSTLGKMVVHLKVLKLRNKAGWGDSWKVTDAGAFPNLEFLFVESRELVNWEASPHCFPMIRCLVLNNCEKLNTIPLSLAPSLESLKLEYVSESAQESAMEMKEEKVRIQGQHEVGSTCELYLSIHP